MNAFLWQVQWDIALKILGGAVAVFTAIKALSGAPAAFRRISKESGMIWKWIMRSAIHRREVDTKLSAITETLKSIAGEMSAVKKEVQFNGSTSMKDGVKRIEDGLLLLGSRVEANSLRLDAQDMCSDRMTFKLDSKGACVFINEAFLKKFGWNEADVEGYSFENIVHDDDVPEMRQKWQMAIDRKHRFFDEQRIYSRDGDVYLCEVRGYPILQANELMEFFGVITIIKQVEP